ncbi:hypothetical protein COCON_G00232350 [Conger conger]|uniref:CWH43-like N-terminal domain-containing protein n=1 Tax=Conger conger TaxID=82655 RepID=A0A9Q1CVI4_CONCO|nr:DNA damage-regulated autophagy modulator protein 1 isoform X2 [Conger conger]KAJ8250019.1 hypothetical protein COCON_G00232350 [Conger conger]
MFWSLEGTSFLPVFLVIWSSSTFIIPYVTAVLEEHVDVIFPYISDTGRDPPESGVFGLMTAITAFTSMVTMFARYKYLQKLQEVVAEARPGLNLAALVCGLVSCLGMCIVGTFQESVLEKPHLVGAFLFFVCGVAYIVMQSAISYRMQPHGSSLCVCRARAAISVMSVLVAIPMIVCTGLLKMMDEWDMSRLHSIGLAGASCEWIVAFGFIFFFFSYIDEFKRFRLTLSLEMLAFN